MILMDNLKNNFLRCSIHTVELLELSYGKPFHTLQSKMKYVWGS